MKELKNYFINLFDPRLLVILLFLVAMCIAITIIFSKKVPEFKQYKTNIYIYLFLTVLVYAVIAFLGYSRLFEGKTLSEFIFYQICTLTLGVFHCYFYRLFFNKFKLEDDVFKELFFALLVVLYASVPFLLIYTFLNGMYYMPLMMGNFIVFFIPTLVNASFNHSLKIPPKIYTTWQFPENYKELVGVSDDEMRDLVVFTLMIKKEENDKDYTLYRAKGPTRIDFGRLFYNFVEDYNERFADAPIEIQNEGGFYNWVFFKQPKWYESTKYIDPKFTLYMNGIEENSYIICMRTLVSDTAINNSDQETDFEYSKEKDNERVQAY